MASVYVNGRLVDEAAWRRGDLLAGMIGKPGAAAAGFPDATTARNAFVGFTPPPIPSGYYDPSLDAQRQSASRGLLNTEQDIGTAGTRAGEDYGLQTAGIERGYARGSEDLTTSRDRGVEDFTTSRDRGLEDIGTQRRYGEEDYTRNVGLLTRQYGQLGRQQAEQARKYGVTSGGIALMSAAKRAENQGIEQQALDIGLTRGREGFDTAGRRVGEDFTRGTTRLGEDYTRGSSRLGEDRTTALDTARIGYDRGVADRGTTLGRARSEDTFYGLDVDAQKNYQAGQAGYQAPTGPANEFTKPDGTRYRVVMRGGYRYEYDQQGRVLNKRKA